MIDLLHLAPNLFAEAPELPHGIGENGLQGDYEFSECLGITIRDIVLRP